jgi:hypothetical protein
MRKGKHWKQKNEERKVTLDRDFEKMQHVDKKKYMTTDKSILLEPRQESNPFNGFPLLQNSTTPREYYSCPIVSNGYTKHQISTVSGQKCTCG